MSLFSGIEAASCAWGPLGWEAVAFSEIDPFCRAVLSARFPHVPNLGDVREVDWKELHGKTDVVIGGEPLPKLLRRREPSGALGRIRPHARVHSGCT